MKAVKLGVISDLPPGTSASFEVHGMQVAVFNVHNHLFAVEDVCPHAGAPLSEGKVVHGHVVCARHRAEFDLKTGAVCSPPASENLRTFRVVVEGDDITVEIPSE